MKNTGIPDQFSTSEERQIAISTLEAEVDRLMAEIEKAYSHLGRSLCAMTEHETNGINEMTDQVVELKQKLRKLKEMDAARPS